MILDRFERPKELRATPFLLPPLLERLGFAEIRREGSVVVYTRRE